MTAQKIRKNFFGPIKAQTKIMKTVRAKILKQTLANSLTHSHTHLPKPNTHMHLNDSIRFAF